MNISSDYLYADIIPLYSNETLPYENLTNPFNEQTIVMDAYINAEFFYNLIPCYYFVVVFIIR